MKRRQRLAGLSLLAVLLGASSAAAHTPYLVPMNFAVTGDHVTLHAAMTGEVFFVPERAIPTTAFSLTDPDGTSQTLTGTSFKDLVLIEAPIAGDGTYKISTEAPGRRFKMAKVDGKWQMVRPATAGAPPYREDAREAGRAGAENAGANAASPQGQQPRRGVDEASLPAGTKIVETQSVTKLETYITKGAPSPVTTTGKGFELKPVTHPNEIFSDQDFTFALLFNGKPVQELSVDVFRGGNAYDDRKVAAETKTDGKGEIRLHLERPGVYLLTARYPERGDPAQEPAAKAYNYALSFEVAP